MRAFIVVDVTVHDPVRYEDYKRMAGPTVSAFDGRYVVRGGKTETLEGDWHPGRAVVLEFPSTQRAKEWWSSEEYRPAKELRQSIATTQMVIFEGM
jgi:uncharacterized protein (DUF1330 family)